MKSILNKIEYFFIKLGNHHFNKIEKLLLKQNKDKIIFQ